jgi:hypothetical protein
VCVCVCVCVLVRVRVRVRACSFRFESCNTLWVFRVWKSPNLPELVFLACVSREIYFVCIPFR